MFQVLDNGKPADYLHHTVDHSWKQSLFQTEEEAIAYAKHWTNDRELKIKCGESVDYSGYGDIVSIVKVG
jgi:hypothetical protein